MAAPDPFAEWNEDEVRSKLLDLLEQKASGAFNTSLSGDGGSVTRRLIRSPARQEYMFRFSLWCKNPDIYPKPVDMRTLVGRFRDR